MRVSSNPRYRFIRGRIAAIAGATLLAASAAAILWAAAGDTVADRVLGQAGFSETAVNLPDGHSLNSENGIAIDSMGHLYAADPNNNRVLGWASAAGFSSGAPADLVIGQADFGSTFCNQGGSGTAPGANTLCQPNGVATDFTGNLYVADTGNNRVLEYDTPFAGFSGAPIAGLAAGVVFGQPDFTTADANHGGVSASSLYAPQALTLDSSGNLFVSDQGNSRVLFYTTPLQSSPANTVADAVFGQPDMSSSLCNQSASPAANPGPATLCDPNGVAVDSRGNLYVADGNNRVLEYYPPIASGRTASLVFGQPGFNSKTANNGGIGAASLSGPASIALDSAGDLYVADTFNNRVLEFITPLAQTGTVGSGDTVADLVVGQSGGSDFQDSQCNTPGGKVPSAASLCEPVAVALDPSGNLYVSDQANSRVLAYSSPLASNLAASRVLGQTRFDLGGANGVNASGLSLPVAVAVDPARHVYVADSDNNRVLGWHDVASFVDGAAADLVIGQPDFLSSACNQAAENPSAQSLCIPGAVATDGSGNLYVADNGNSRVLEFNTPFAAFTGAPIVEPAANVVFGQGGSFTTGNLNAGGVSADSLAQPQGLAVDPGGNLYVADTGNNRVLEYDTPLANPSMPNTTASRVFGQDTSGTDFTGSACNLGNGIGGQPASSSLCFPAGIAIDSSANLYVADANNNRVLEYNSPLTVNPAVPGSGDVVADVVFGQPDFVSNSQNGPSGTPDAANLQFPEAVAIDASGNLYIGDTSNERVLEYDAALANPAAPNTTADLVFGQGSPFDFADSLCNSSENFLVPASATSLCEPSGVAVDPSGDLLVADSSNNRVVVFDRPVPYTGPTPAPTAMPSATATPAPTATPTSTPTPTPTSAPTAPVSPTPTASPTATATIAATPSPSPTATPSASPSATTSATPTPTAIATPTPAPTVSATPTPTPTPTSTVSAAPTATSTSSPAATPTPTATPTATATPVAVKLHIAPAHVNFGKVAPGATGEPRNVTLKNSKKGKRAAPITIVSISASPDFAVSPGCIGELAPGAKCVVTVTFSPSVAAKETGTLTVVSNAVNPTAIAQLKGRGFVKSAR